MNKATAFLACLCVAMAIALGIKHIQLVEAREQNARMELQMQEMSKQVNEIWAEYMGQMKRIQQHGGQNQ